MNQIKDLENIITELTLKVKELKNKLEDKKDSKASNIDMKETAVRMILILKYIMHQDNY